MGRTAVEVPDTVGNGRYGWKLSVSARKTCDEPIFKAERLYLAHSCRGFHPPSLGCCGQLMCHRYLLVGAHGERAA